MIFGVFVYDVLIFLIPLILIILSFASGIYYFKGKKDPTISLKQLKKRKIIFFIILAITLVFVTFLLGLIALLFMAIAYM